MYAGASEDAKIYLTPVHPPPVESMTPEQARRQPYAFLLTVNDTCVLLDAGAPLDYDSRSSQWIANYARIIDSVDAVLLSGPEVQACGALPLICRLAPGIPVYALSATLNQGRAAVLGTFLAVLGNKYTFSYTDPQDNEAKLQITTDDIFSAFKYKAESEVTGFQARINSRNPLPDEIPIEARAFPTGRILGACGWVINKDVCYAPTLYCPDPVSELLKPWEAKRVGQPRVLLADGCPASVPTMKRNNGLDLVTLIRESLDKGNNVIIPCDVMLRGLEVLQLIVARPELREFRTNLCLVHPYADAVQGLDRFTESIREGMGSFNNVKHFYDVKDLRSMPSPWIALCEGADLDYGPAAEVIAMLSGELSKLCIVFTSVPAPDTNAERIFHCFFTNTGIKGIPRGDAMKGCLVEGSDELRYCYTLSAVDIDIDDREIEEQAESDSDESSNVLDLDFDIGADENEGGRPNIALPSSRLFVPVGEPSKGLIVKNSHYALFPTRNYREPPRSELTEDERNIIRRCTEGLFDTDLTVTVRNEAKRRARVYRRIKRVECLLRLRQSEALYSDLTAQLDAKTLWRQVGKRFQTSQHIVFIRGRPGDVERALQDRQRRGQMYHVIGSTQHDNIMDGRRIDLTSDSAAYRVLLAPELTQSLATRLKFVVTKSNEESIGARPNDVSGGRNGWGLAWLQVYTRGKRAREDDSAREMRTFQNVPEALHEQAAASMAEQGMNLGSIFVGSLEPEELMNALRGTQAPSGTGAILVRTINRPGASGTGVVVANDYTFIRQRPTDQNGVTEVMIESILSQDAFEVRRGVYDYFKHRL